MGLINLKNVTKLYGSYAAVNNVSFEMTRGRIHGILGPNGAGKTSTLRMINFITAPDSGTITIDNTPVSESTQKLIGYLPEERGLYKKMKVFEQLMYLARLKGLSKSKANVAINYWLDRFEASDWKQKEIGELSKGMQQKIQFISTIAHDPDICIFDEPFSGLDPINSEILKDIIIELKEKGKTIIFATHRMEQVEQMCDDITLFNVGEVLLSGNLKEIKQSFGLNTIELDFDGESSFLNRLENVRINNRSNNFAEIRLLEDANPQSILQQAMQTCEINRFELIYPSLQEIFITTVKNHQS